MESLKGYSTFFGNKGSFYNSPRVKLLSFTIFESIQLIFWYLEEYQISETRQFLVSLTSIVGKKLWTVAQTDLSMSGSVSKVCLEILSM